MSNRWLKIFGRLDVLVHSAGGPVPGGFYAVSDESWMNAFAVHVHSIFYITRAAAPHMAKQGGGAIILLGSAAGLRGCFGAFAYGVVKGALPQFARVWAGNLRSKGSGLIACLPGLFGLLFMMLLFRNRRGTMSKIESRCIREGKPEDVADLITTLVENEFYYW